MIHIFQDAEGNFSVWSDCETSEHKSGRCIGTGATRDAAIADAEEELLDDLNQLVLKAPETIHG